ncbi:MAG: L-ribulose-5-phosphate 4-epimerase [Eubacteriales bacterium]|nr:L-ribulose-5-phosphate 4-epimerase [Eubacteriales bacterium]
MFKELKREVYEANLLLLKNGLIILTWGNVSRYDKDEGIVAIKPSGVQYKEMRPEDIVITDIEGKTIQGDLQPSSDLHTHLELYRRFPGICGIVHTHSRYATICAQAEKAIPCMGTTHADNFYGSVPCTRHLTEEEIAGDYELNTGKVIVETFQKGGLDDQATPGVLVCKHGPFTWGASASKAVENAVVLEEVAAMYIMGVLLNPKAGEASKALMDKHYYRKHGANAYYGQSNKKDKT